jgi:hypothetical protein
VAEYLQRPVAAAPPASPDVTAPTPYSTARDLLPTGWSPVLGAIEEVGGFIGVETRGEDVIGRHAWQGTAATGSMAA